VARVFVSHAGDGCLQADQVYRWLVEAGHEVFLDRARRDGITVGEQWRQRLHERLRWADAVVCVVTSAYRGSRWCAAEVEIARSRGSWLLPLQAEPGAVDPALESVQHLDMAGDPATTRADLVAKLRRVDAVGGAGWPDDRSPFPGLRPFGIDQHRVFFGRAKEKKELTELLRSPAVRAGGAALLIVGPSGCGKSSLVRAGLLPALAGESGWWPLGPIVPGADPVAELARELASTARRIGLDWTLAQVRQQLDNKDLVGLVDELLLAAPGGPQRRLLVVVDQVEELLTQTAPADRGRFVELLRAALAGPVQLVATLRSEFLDQLLLNPALGGMAATTYMVRPLGREALRSVIEKPARLAGIGVDPALADRLVEDTDTGDALPLLAFTLAQLAEGVTRGGQLSATRYEQLGGVQGALTRQADQALAAAVSAAGRSRHEVIAGLLRLVTVDEQGRPTRWRTRRDELPAPVATELDAFVEHRLLTTDDTNNGGGVISVAHEAFLSAWPPLRDAIAASACALRARRAVEHAATSWHENGRPSSRLWGGGQLAAAVADTGVHFHIGQAPPHVPPPSPRCGLVRWLPHRHRVLVTDRVDLSLTSREFLHTSIRRDRFRRRRAVTVLSMLLVGVLVGAGLAVIGQQAAQAQQRIAIARQLMAQADVVRDTDPHTALQFGVAAQRIYPSPETQSSLVYTLTNTRYAGTLTGRTGQVLYTVAFAPDGNTLATANSDGTVTLWSLTDPGPPRQLGPPLTGQSRAVFAPTGNTLATASQDGTVTLWDLTNPVQPRQLGQFLTGQTNHVYEVAFAPTGNILATAGRNAEGDGTVTLWGLTNPVQPRQLGQFLTGQTNHVYEVAFAPTGEHPRHC
jgi:energy-coupling factor transporter ATP-binding protein EcfA2